MEKCILIVALFTIYFHIGGLATTNILRLTKGNKADVNYPHCTCDNCGIKCCNERMKESSEEDAKKYLEKK